VAKYTLQARLVVRETPATYASVVAPYISSFPAERTAWVGAILDGTKEAERVIFSSQGEDGFVLLPDLKWDGTTRAALYLTALVRDASLRSLRDLRRAHLPLLTRIREQAYASCGERYGVLAGQLRLFIHYQPSYCEC
jgi:m7GpppX diphosphatase